MANPRAAMKMTRVGDLQDRESYFTKIGPPIPYEIHVWIL
jgi:hypothetical protein